MRAARARAAWGHARRLILWCCVFYVLLMAAWVTDPAAGAEPARVVAARVAVAASTLGPAFYVAWRGITARFRRSS